MRDIQWQPAVARGTSRPVGWWPAARAKSRHLCVCVLDEIDANSSGESAAQPRSYEVEPLPRRGFVQRSADPRVSVFSQKTTDFSTV